MSKYFELEISENCTELSNAFWHYKYTDKFEKWKDSKLPLRFTKNGKPLADLVSYDSLMNNRRILNVIKKNSTDQFWFPSFICHKANLFRVYDEKWGDTAQGKIPVYEEPKTLFNTNLKDNKRELGELGENIIKELFPRAERAEDWYDSEKDGNIGDLRYEVKTLQLNNRDQGFWMGQNKSNTMWDKLDGVDILFWIRVPSPHDRKPIYELEVYMSIDHKKSWNYTIRNDGVRVRNYPLTKCLKLGSIKDNRVQKAKFLSEQIMQRKSYEV